MQNSSRRAPNAAVITQQKMPRRAEPLGRPMLGWQTRFRYLAARMNSLYSSEQEKAQCRADLGALRAAVSTIHATLRASEIAADETGILADVDLAYRRLLDDIDDTAHPAIAAAE